MRTLVLLLTLIEISACSSARLKHVRSLAQAPAEPIVWVELGPSFQWIARAITGASICPQLRVDGYDEIMQLRAAPTEKFPVRVCEAGMPASAKSAQIEGQTLALPAAQPKKVLFFGDSGCRIVVKGDHSQVQACNDPKAWPFPRMARTESEKKPDLVVHLGDYLYRESPCPAGNASCAGSPSGDTWETWNADFFDAARPLLKTAPWVFVRGNHELCSRAGEGWFRFLDPRPMGVCADMTPPYLVQNGSVQLVVLDSALATDLKAPADQVKLYRAQLDSIAEMPLEHAWLVTHKPFWAPGYLDLKAPEQGAISYNQTLQTASGNQLPSGIDLTLAGHLHLFESFEFADGRPAQLIAGNGGTYLSTPQFINNPAGLRFAGTTVKAGVVFDHFGYFTIDSVRSAEAWEGTAFDGDGNQNVKCTGAGRSLKCIPLDLRL